MIREKISEVVDQYVADPKNKTNYEAVCEYIVQKRKTLIDSKMGEGESGYHALYELPTELNAAIHRVLTPEEKAEWSKMEHKRWFANTYPQFRLPDEV